MEDFLRIVEEPPQPQVEIQIDASKVKFFNTKAKIWDYAPLSFSDYHKLSMEDRSSTLKAYYAEMCKRFSTGSGIFCIFFFWILLVIFLLHHSSF